jgi:hypothetical protein
MRKYQELLNMIFASEKEIMNLQKEIYEIKNPFKYNVGDEFKGKDWNISILDRKIEKEYSPCFDCSVYKNIYTIFDGNKKEIRYNVNEKEMDIYADSKMITEVLNQKDTIMRNTKQPLFTESQFDIMMDLIIPSGHGIKSFKHADAPPKAFYEQMKKKAREYHYIID